MAKAKTGKSVKTAKSAKASKSVRSLKKASSPSPKARKAVSVGKKAPVKQSAKKAAVVSEVRENEVTICRRRSDRRGEEREATGMPKVAAAKSGTPKAVAPKAGPPIPERRQKVARRRQIDPTTCERDYSDDEIEFMHALDAYKRSSGRMFPTCSEVLEVLRGLGYAKQLTLATDAAEDSPAGVVATDEVTVPANLAAPLDAMDSAVTGCVTFESVLIG